MTSGFICTHVSGHLLNANRFFFFCFSVFGAQKPFFLSAVVRSWGKQLRESFEVRPVHQDCSGQCNNELNYSEALGKAVQSCTFRKYVLFHSLLLHRDYF